LDFILYVSHLTSLAVLVMTSDPDSKMSGIRLANRITLTPVDSVLPPSDTAASTMKEWPSNTRTFSWYVLTISGLNSLLIPRYRL